MGVIPERVRAMAEMPPIEDVILYLLREAFPDVPVHSLVPLRSDLFPFILARGSTAATLWDGDERFIDSAIVAIHTFTEDPDGDDQGAVLSEAIRIALRDAARRQVRLPGGARLHKVTVHQRPRRVTDWATSTGPVQYADLPAGTYRYETTYRVWIRRANS